MNDRRIAPRQPVDVLFNKHVGGHPYLCCAADLSRTGLRARRTGEPEGSRAHFVLELCLPGTDASIWVWARRVWQAGSTEAIEFVGMDAADRAALHGWLDAA